MPDDEPRPLDGLETQLDEILAVATEARDEARNARHEAEEAKDESRQTNGRVSDLEVEIYGPKEERRRDYQPGLKAEVKRTKRMAAELAAARDESAAVRDAVKEIRKVGYVVAGLMIPALGLLLRIAGVIG